MRNDTKIISIGNVKIGGGNPIAIQSMTNTDTRNIEKTVAQIRQLEQSGCEIVRCAVLDAEAAAALKEIKRQIGIPLIADIHFDYRLAIRSVENGADKIRINPGNIGSEQKIAEVVKACKDKGVPIRVGVNSGSLEKDIVMKSGGVTADGLVESALRHVNILERMNFTDIIVAIKSPHVPVSFEAHNKLSRLVNYPLHIGITESGTHYSGSVKSAAGIGAILLSGIGDTIRVSLNADPVEEVRCAREILKALELRKFGISLICCPTCGRTEVDLISIAGEIEKKCLAVNKEITVAVMGCAVNGPGEAKEADVGVAGGRGTGIIFKKGEAVKKVAENEIISELMKEIESF